MRSAYGKLGIMEKHHFLFHRFLGLEKPAQESVKGRTVFLDMSKKTTRRISKSFNNCAGLKGISLTDDAVTSLTSIRDMKLQTWQV